MLLKTERSEISKKLITGDNQLKENISIDGHIIIETYASISEENEESNNKITTIRIKTESGKHTLIIKMFYNQHIKDIYDIINNYKESKGCVEIKTTFPNKVYKLNNTETLEELGLIPNVNMIIKSLN